MQVPEWIGPYKPVQLLGRGAFGEVHLASDPRRQGQLVALKVGTRHGLDDEAEFKAREGVLREGSFLRRLKHPHIVSCYDLGWDCDQHIVWLALELLDGGTLRDLLASRRSVGTPFHASFIRRVLIEIGGALQYSHSEDVLHRDVKPANILLTLSAPPVLKLADFGISKLLEGTGLAHSIVGTQYYFSPELAAGQPYGAASDAWALGVCLYELAALRRPFDATGGPFALACKIREEPPPALPPDTAPDIASTIDGFLEKDALKRLHLPDALTSLEVEEDVILDAEDQHAHSEHVEGESTLEVEELIDTEPLRLEDMSDTAFLTQTASAAPQRAFEAPLNGERKLAFRKEKEPERQRVSGRWFNWMPSLFSKSVGADTSRTETEVKEIIPSADDGQDSADGRD